MMFVSTEVLCPSWRQRQKYQAALILTYKACPGVWPGLTFDGGILR
ncbi:MAG: hypothetical protein JW860_03575 [Sedimentisphaerales bacterium]|nr:hypothetical protein [Sedimentisphaerales bacterium]